MTEDLLHTIQESLRLRWEHKLPRLLERARMFASAANGRLRGQGAQADVEKALRDAFTMGYREGYWEGVIDVVECGANSDRVRPLTESQDALLN